MGAGGRQGWSCGAEAGQPGADYIPCSGSRRRATGWGMTKAAARKLARMLRAAGAKVRVRRRRPARGVVFFTVERV